MTDYNRWNSFNAEHELERTAERMDVEDFVDASNKADTASKELADVQVNTLRIAEALKSKDAVLALKAKTFPGRRRMKQSLSKDPSLAEGIHQQTRECGIPSDAPNIDKLPQDTSTMLQLAGAISTVSAALQVLGGRADAVAQLAEGPTSPRDKAAGTSSGLEILQEIEAFKNGSFSAALGLHLAVKGDTDASDSALESSLATLRKVDSALDGLTKQVLSHVALCALGSGQYALSADAARCRLRLEPSSGGGSRQASVWLTRALAFTGMGCVHLANVHCRQTKLCAPSYPHIDSLLAFLDIDETFHLRVGRSLPAVLRSVETEIRRQLGAGVSDPAEPSHNVSIFDVRTDLLEWLLQRSEKVRDREAATMAYVNETVLHLGESSSPLPADTDDTLACSSDHPCISASEVDALLTAMTMASANSNLDDALSALHEIFYQAQIMYLELMFQSAESKYYVAVVIASGILRCRDSFGHVPPLESVISVPPLESVISACYINAAACRMQRNKLSLSSTSKEPTPPATVPSELLRCSARDLCFWGLRLQDTVAGRLRVSLVLEEMQLFDEALDVLDRASVEEGELHAGFVPHYGPSPSFSQLFMRRDTRGEALAMPLMPCSASPATAAHVQSALSERRDKVLWKKLRNGG